MPRKNTERNLELATEVGHRVRVYRMKRGLAQEKLAYMADMSFGTLSKIENGRAVPSLETLERLAEVLDIHVRDLIPERDLNHRTGSGWFQHIPPEQGARRTPRGRRGRKRPNHGDSTNRAVAA